MYAFTAYRQVVPRNYSQIIHITYTDNMNVPQLIISIVTAIILLLTTELLKDIPTPHNHIEEPVRRNVNLHTQITLCIQDDDTMQVAFPNTNLKKHIPYDSQ